jgi:hypothetical protein
MKTHGVRPAPGNAPAPHAWEAPAPRQCVTYACDRGHDFTLVLAAVAVPPPVARCRCGGTGSVGGQVPGPGGQDHHARHLRQLHERRTRDELELILAERLAELPRIRYREWTIRHRM